MYKLFVAAVFLLVLASNACAQIDSSASGNVEVYLIDSFITPETPHKLVISFFTSDSATSKILVINAGEFKVSDKLSENHKIEIDLHDYPDLKSPINYKIYVADKDGEQSQSQLYEVDIPQNLILENDRDLGMLQVCCFGGIIFGLPSPTYVVMNKKSFFSLSKEIPVVSFYSKGYNYPIGYFAAGYSYIFNADRKNFLRIGYKQILQTGIIKFISPGINYYTDFKGYNGMSPEITFGLFQVANVFTLFTRYRYNFRPGRSGNEFHEISIGLYSNFFSFNF